MYKFFIATRTAVFSGYGKVIIESRCIAPLLLQMQMCIQADCMLSSRPPETTEKRGVRLAYVNRRDVSQQKLPPSTLRAYSY